ncbi:ABC transporter permease [Virgibacillus pantothenticus]|uniref:ABC transporter permease n=1 Tax=Virgibacillus pantothenticus TaxID=1473 RepID=UPI00147E4286|nr:ABC transporter permease [Virgibacillus pantothenticus]
MIRQIIKKQFLLLWRNPVQLLLLIALPIILIFILGCALSSFMNGDTPEIEAKIAIIEHRSETEQLDQFLLDMNGRTDFHKENMVNMEKALPIQTLKSIFNTEALSEMVEVEEVSVSKKEEILNDNSYTAVIEVPEDFTYKYLSHTLLNGDEMAELLVMGNEQQQIGAGVIHSIIENFQQQLTLGTFLEQKGLDQQIMSLSDSLLESKRTSLQQNKIITAKDYYTVGMAVMNALFIASTIGTIAFREKKMFVFNRIILANMSKWVYFSGILCSAVIFTFFQLCIIYGFAWLIFDVTWENMFAFLIITIAFSVAVGGIAVLLTAISYQMHSETITNFFSGAIVALMALVGGSFFPIGDSSELIQAIGNFTPNGSGMSAYLSILRGNSLQDIGSHILFLCLFGSAMIIIAALTFPKKGEMV